jgi:hypothetical protein
VWFQPDAAVDKERFASMSVTRNPQGALIPNRQRELVIPRESDPLVARRVRVARAPPGPEDDVDGSHPKPLHVAKSGHRDPLDVADIASHRAAALVTKREVNPLNPTYALPSAGERVLQPLELPFKHDLTAVDDIPGAKTLPRVDTTKPVRISVRQALLPGRRAVPLPHSPSWSLVLHPQRPPSRLLLQSAPQPRAMPRIRTRRGPFPDVLNVTDINREGKFVSARST